jgi:hypothetical protein
MKKNIHIMIASDKSMFTGVYDSETHKVVSTASSQIIETDHAKASFSNEVSHIERQLTSEEVLRIKDTKDPDIPLSLILVDL